MKKILMTLLAALSVGTALAWPDKNVSVVVPFPAGGSTDMIGRAIASKLQDKFGGVFIVDNKAGATGTIGAGMVAKAAPDGHTLLVASLGPYVVAPHLLAKVPYDALKDFAPVALGPKTPNIITANPSVNAKTLPEWIELAKKTPMSYASSGIGTTTHLSMERLKAAAKIDVTHVPYQPAAAINAVVAGHTPVASTSMPPAVPMVNAGRLKALAVTSATRSPLLSNVPSITEYGYKEFDDYTWFGFFLPAGTPPAVVERFNTVLNQAMANPAVVENFNQLGMASTPNTTAEFNRFLRSEVPKWAAVIKSSGAKAD